MIDRLILLSLLASALAAPLCAATPSAPAKVEYHRVLLSLGQGKDLPYTIEVPKDWTIRPAGNAPGIWVGPPDAKTSADPRMIWVRGSRVSLADPETVASNIRANDAQNDQWTAPRVEVKDLGGVRGLLVRMDTGTGDAMRSTLTLKVPLANAALDLVASATNAEIERVLLSVRPADLSKELTKKDEKK